MKLGEILDSLGDKLSRAEIAAINRAVDELKAKAIAKVKESEHSSADLEKLQKELQEKEEALKGLQKELAPFKEKEAIKKDIASFKEAKGKEDIDITDYNYKKYINADGIIEWDKFFEKHPSLREEEKSINKDQTLELQESQDLEDEIKHDIEELNKDSKLANV